MSYTPYIDQDFQVRYSLTEAPAANANGYVLHSITAQYSADRQEWTDDVSFSVVIPAPDLESVLAMNDGAPKVQAYKQLLESNRNTVVRGIGGRAPEAIARRANEAARASAAAAGADTYIMSVGGAYPVGFAL